MYRYIVAGLVLYGLFLAAAGNPASVFASAPPPVHRAPAADSIGGRVTDSDGKPVSDADVRLVELGRVTTTGDDGRFGLREVPSGTYTLSVSRLGYAPRVQQVTVSEGGSNVEVALETSAIELPALQVSASAVATSTLDSPQPVSVEAQQDLARVKPVSLGAALAGMAGVHNNSSGPAAGKPVIRGLTNSRVLVVDDGQRLEHNQWGDDHFTSVEPAAASRIEVIRGPQSVLYGSDALGGVVNIVEPDLPDAIGGPPSMGGRLSAGYVSGNRQADGTLALQGADGGVGFRGSLTGRTADQLQTPDYLLWNSGYHEVEGDATVGYRGAWGSLKAGYTLSRDRLQLTDEDPTATPYARTNDDRGHLDLDLPLGDQRLTWNVGYEANRRMEFGEATATDPSFFMKEKTITTEGRLHHSVGPFDGIVGVSGEYSDDGNLGEEHLAPDSRSGFVGAYAFEQTDVGPWNFSFGARFDHRYLNAKADPVLGNDGANLSWNAVTGNVGVLYHLSRPLALVLNLGRGFRSPSVFDLFANGLHEATSTFERGNPDLKTETSFNTDLELRLQTSSAVAEVGGFVNRISDFIYTVPANQVDPQSGFEIYDVTQGDAVLAGFEAQLRYHPTSWLHLQGTADYVHGQNTSAGQPLPSMPPLRVTYTARLEGRDMGALQNPYVSLGGESNARQDRLNPNEAAFFASALDGTGYEPSAFTLVDLGGGFGLEARPGRSVRIDLELKNVFNQPWADFLSHLKTNAPDPGMGRSLMIRLSTEL